MRLAITGSPGTGKHTAASLARRGPVIDINAVALEEGLVEGGAADAGRLAVALAGRITPECTVVGHLAPYVLDAAQVDVAVVLRRSPYDLVRVYSQRGYPGPKSAENAAAEILGVVAHDAFAAFGAKAVQVDAGARGPAGTAARIAGALAGDMRGDGVDWLGTVAGRGDLARFFAY